MARVIGALMLVVAAVVFAVIKYRDYRNGRTRSHNERMAQSRVNKGRRKFRLLQYETANIDIPHYKPNVKLDCRDARLAPIFAQGIQGIEAYKKTAEPVTQSGQSN